MRSRAAPQDSISDRVPGSEPASGEFGFGDAPVRVLFADDDLILRRCIKRVLEREGYEVTTAEHGLEAAALVQQQDFDVVLSDIAMPKLDGIQLLRVLHETTLDVPVVLITGEPAVSTAVKALEYGAFHYLTKPVHLPTLLEVVAKAARLRRMTQMEQKAAELVQKASSDGVPQPARDVPSRARVAVDGLPADRARGLGSRLRLRGAAALR